MRVSIVRIVNPKARALLPYVRFERLATVATRIPEDAWHEGGNSISLLRCRGCGSGLVEEPPLGRGLLLRRLMLARRLLALQRLECCAQLPNVRAKRSSSWRCLAAMILPGASAASLT